MSNTAKLFIVLGVLLIVVAAITKITWMSFMISMREISSGGLMVLANTAFILSLLVMRINAKNKN